jgi:glycosyltransferase involved in cell wall biosynthesis
MAIAGVSDRMDHRAQFRVPVAPIELDELTEPPTFSIVIPAYQAAETIGHALNSALDQVHPAHEVIVVDDGSTDDLDGALDPYKDRVTVVRKENGGAASARNMGVELAGGEFMAVLDADDRFHRRRLEALAQLAMARPDLDLITTDTRFIVNEEAAGSFRDRNPFALEGQRTAILDSCFVGGWPAARLSRLRSIGGFDESLPIGHDWDCWIRLILEGALAGLVDRPYYDYILREDSLTSSRVASLWDRVRLLEKAAANPALLPEDKPALARSCRRHRSRAVEAETYAVLYQAGPRRNLAKHALSKGVELRSRALATLALILPSLARKFTQPDQPPRRETRSAPPVST